MQVDGVGGVGRPSAASPCVWDKGCGVGVMEGVGGGTGKVGESPEWGVGGCLGWGQPKGGGGDPQRGGISMVGAPQRQR